MFKNQQKTFLRLFSIVLLLLNVSLGFGQKVKNVPKAFKAIETEPETIFINNELKVPTEGGHLQGVQVVIINGREKLLVSGSSLSQAYILQADLAVKSTERLIILKENPYRHAGGFQVSEPFLAVGIEDNYLKTDAKVCVYNFLESNLNIPQPNFVIDRVGEPKEKTAGSTGIIADGNNFLIVVSNWDSRNWDFYVFDPDKGESQILESFTAPNEWPSYQSINLVKDKKAIYAIGFYQKEDKGYADLIIVSKHGKFQPIMKLLNTKTFNVNNAVDFHTAAGLQVDVEGKLHIWATQRDAKKQIAVNRFSQL
ncbi:hypothetical protein SAMN06298216_0639 [Spirosomataceae bacterium TFI 002]|nr:hypothetical protein SAMN06298216_0639 [Spirosomataceae bacterium TFI 002]